MATLHIVLPLDDMTWGDIEFEPNGEPVGLLSFVDPAGVVVNGS